MREIVGKVMFNGEWHIRRPKRFSMDRFAMIDYDLYFFALSAWDTFTALWGIQHMNRKGFTTCLVNDSCESVSSTFSEKPNNSIAGNKI